MKEVLYTVVEEGEEEDEEDDDDVADRRPFSAVIGRLWLELKPSPVCFECFVGFTLIPQMLS